MSAASRVAKWAAQSDLRKIHARKAKIRARQSKDVRLLARIAKSYGLELSGIDKQEEFTLDKRIQMLHKLAQTVEGVTRLENDLMNTDLDAPIERTGLTVNFIGSQRLDRKEKLVDSVPAVGQMDADMIETAEIIPERVAPKIAWRKSGGSAE